MTDLSELSGIRILLVDDHPLVRDGLRARLASQPCFRIVAEAGSAEDAMRQADAQAIDVALLDINLGGASGIELAARFRVRFPAVAVLMLSMHDGADYVAHAVQAGARGYVLKGAPAAEIIAAIDAVMAGNSYYSAQLGLPAAAAAPRPSAVLTPREKEVLNCIAQGQSTKHIARELDLSLSTVDTHRINIKRKLGISGKAELIRFALTQQTSLSG